AEPAVELLQELGPYLFIQMDEITCITWGKFVPAHFQGVDFSLIGEILARKEKADIFLLIPNRKAIPERSLVTSPSAPEAELVIDICAIRVKRLPPPACNHGL